MSEEQDKVVKQALAEHGLSEQDLIRLDIDIADVGQALIKDRKKKATFVYRAVSVVILCLVLLVAAGIVGTLINYAEDESRTEELKNTEVMWGTPHLEVANTNIDYEVAQWTDNDYYLTHDIRGTENKSGWIFMDYRVTEDSDNVIIYGHNRVSGSMFGDLNKLLSNAYFEDTTDVITYWDGAERYTYRVFSVFTIEAETGYLQCDFEGVQEKEEYIALYKAKNMVRRLNAVTVDTGAKLITLSTCSPQGRLVVMGYCIEGSEE